MLDHFQRAQMNAVRVSESSWGNLESASGEFDFGWLHNFLDDLERWCALPCCSATTYCWNPSAGWATPSRLFFLDKTHFLFPRPTPPRHPVPTITGIPTPKDKVPYRVLNSAQARDAVACLQVLPHTSVKGIPISVDKRRGGQRLAP